MVSFPSLNRPLLLAAVVALLALRPLQAAPEDFTVQSVPAGKTFRLADARGSYVVLHFLLKTECPVCLRHVRDYSKHASDFPGVLQVFLKPDAEEDILKWSQRLGGDTVSTVTLYRDPEAKLATAFEIPDGYKFHGETVHFPALVILDPQGHEVFRYVGKNNTDRFSVQQLTDKLKELKKSDGATPAVSQ